MKNIHIISTDKPSRLFTWGNKLRLGDLVGCPDYFGKLNKNIYITSDEEIKEGDWYLNGKLIFKADSIFDEGNNPNNSNPKVTDFNKKIILTTDQELIKDGVQAIEDEFLEWFIENPSCEKVEIEYLVPKVDNPFQQGILNGLAKSYPDIVKKPYIIIPKEEPKQETLEEVAERMFTLTSDDFSNYIRNIQKQTWIAGAKWQQEQDKNKFSEEEVLVLLHKRDKHNIENPITFKGWETPKEWFEQIKKK